MKASRKPFWIWFVGIIAVIIAVFFLGKVGFSYLDELIFEERQAQLQEVVNQYFNGLDIVTADSWKMAHEVEKRFAGTDFQTVQDIQTFFEKENAYKDLTEQGSAAIAIRSDGQYIDADGAHGSLGYVDPLVDSGERVSYIYEKTFTGELYNLYVYKLETPVEVTENGHSYRVEFVGVTRTMESLNPYFRCTAYGGDNSTYILDRYGAKQYVDRSSSMNMIEGHNVYTVLRNEAAAEGRDFDTLLDELEENGVMFSHININGEQCFFSLRKMQDVDYTIVYVNPVDRVAVSTQRLVNLVVMVVVIAAGVLLLVVVLAALYVMRRNRRQLEIETEARQKLLALNNELEANNKTLEEARATIAEALQTAEKASKAKSDFLTNMSHDIRTPMNAIVGIVRLMEHENGLSDKMHAYIDKVMLSSQHLLSLINDVLDMSQIESSEVTLTNEPISLADQVGQVESIIRPQIEERGQHLTIRAHEIAHEYIMGDPVRLRQIFLNLLSNAVKYTQNGGEVWFDIGELPSNDPAYANLHIVVTDNGCGMTKEFAEHIFEPFTRAVSSTTNKVQGTGLGMAIVKNIVDLAGGTITVQSELNKGSCFDVTLPMLIDQQRKKEIAVKGVLLVADEEVLTHNVAAALNEANVPFYAASTKEEAAAILDTETVEIILLAGCLYDTALGETVRNLRRAAQDNVLVFCCDYAQPEQVHEILTSNGVDGLIPRPFFLSNLVHAIEQLHGKDPQEAEESISTFKGMKFLCAEDNEINAEILQAMLEMDGATCKIYPNGQELVNAFENVKPGEYDMILMDVMMPVMDGLEATRQIRKSKNPLGQTIPIVAMTANAFEEDKKKALEAGMDAHLAKPMDLEKLKRTVQRFRVTPPPDKNNGGVRYSRG